MYGKGVLVGNQIWLGLNKNELLVYRVLLVTCSTVSVRVMRTLTKYTTFLTPDNSINMALINDALAKIESLEPSEKFSYTEIANKYSVWRSTLTRRYKAKV